MRTLLIICAFLCAVPLIAGSGKKVVCYWNAFSAWNEGLKGMFEVKDIDPKICTHIIYAYIRFTSTGLIFEDYVEVDVRAFTNLRSQNSNLKLLLGVGGPRQGSQILSQLAENPTKRAAFSQTVKNFINDYGFDGCDLDWQWPGQGSGSVNDKVTYVELLQDLKSVLGASKIFSISVASRQEDIEKSYDVSGIIQHVDFINLNTYNFHGIEGENFTAFHSPYRKALNDQTKEGEWNAVSVVANWLSHGVPADKLTLGIPTYGRSFTLSDITQTGVGAPVDGIGLKSEYSIDNTNIIPYMEICFNILTNPRWNYFWNSAQFAPYAVFGANQWVGFDDLQVIRTKIHLALENNLGGLNYATIDRDDFSAQCGGPKYPLIRMGYDAMVNDILPPNPLSTTTPKTTSTSSTSTSSTSTSSTSTSSTSTSSTSTSSTSTSSTSTSSSSTSSTSTTPISTTPVSKDPDTDDKITTTEPITTELITTTEPITTILITTTEPITTELITTTEPLTTETTILPTTSSTSTKITVPKTTKTRTTTTRTTTSENPTPPITPNNGISTSILTSETGILSTLTTEEILSTREVTTTKKLPSTTSTGYPTPPVTPNGNLGTTQNSQSTQRDIQETTEIIQETSSNPSTTVIQTTSSRTTTYNIPTPPVTPGKSKAKRSAEYPIEISYTCPEENGKFTNPDDCSSYIVCVSNVPYKFYCNSDKYYDELKNHCDYQLNLKC